MVEQVEQAAQAVHLKLEELVAMVVQAALVVRVMPEESPVITRADSRISLILSLLLPRLPEELA
jgi:hypothetical protein